MRHDVEVNPAKKAEAPPEIRVRYGEIQDAMGVPGPPANWTAYAAHPGVMRLFWERLAPAVTAERFLRDALAIAEPAYRAVAGWCRPSHNTALPEHDRRRIGWELDAVELGNPQLLIQQTAPSRAIRGS